MANVMISSAFSFLQSQEWELFQKRLGRKTWRVDGVLLIRNDLPFGLNYIYAPRPAGEKITAAFLEKAAAFAKAEQSVFLKIDPESKPAFSFSHRNGKNLQPLETLVLDLTKPEDALLSAMHQKTRYNIRLASKHGVTVKKESGEAAAEQFFRLLKETAARDGFHAHPESHYRQLAETHSDDFANEFFFAKYQGSALAAALVNWYRPSGTATYLHGASSNLHREIMAPHLLHWEIIREAQRRGFQHYDFWGIDEKKWPGVTRFKLGFGGERITYPAARDIPYRTFLYRVYEFLKK